MKTPDTPANEALRQQALDEYNILDTLPEQDFDDITALASQICQTPIALISLIDKKRQWFKSHHGINTTQTPRDHAFCAHAILQPDMPFVIPDSQNDNRFVDNPLVINEPHVMFYAGIPLVDNEGFALGTLCVIDHKAKQITDEQIKALKILAKQTVNLLELRKNNAYLEQTRKELEQRNNDLKQFAYTIAHDIKSPLASINSAIDFLKISQKQQLNDKTIHSLDSISQSATKLRSFVDEILNYYKGDIIVKQAKTAVELKPFLENVIDLLPITGNFDISLPQQNPIIHINVTAMEQIFHNLLTNSIKYNDKKITSINIDFSSDDQFYYFTVSDNGIGIAPDKINAIFDLFTIGGVPDRYGKFGTGIGLATVKKLVEAQGGTISVQSEVGKGATFSFSIKATKI